MRLSKRTSFLIILIVVALLVGGLIGFYFYTKNHNKPVSFLGQSGGRSIGYNPSINSPATSTQTTNLTMNSIPVVIPKLRHITDQPVAGADFVFVDVFATTSDSIDSSTLAPVKINTTTKTPKPLYSEERMRWIERGTGNVFETSTTTLNVTRLSNTTITRLYEAFFTNKGNSLILRDLVGSTDVIRTRYATMNLDTPTSTEQVLTTTDLPTNITQMVRSPDRSQIFSIMEEGTRGILSNTDGSAKVGIFDTPFKEWLVQWPNKNGIILTTKPSGAALGYAYILNPTTQAFGRVMGDVNGLTTTVSPDLSTVVYSESDSGSVELYSYNRNTAQSTDLFVRTFADKCVWSPVEKSIIYCGVPGDMAFDLYPDAWYQGTITFSDSIWRINTDTGQKNLIVSPVDEVGSIIDVINPTISSEGTYMMFQNKIDLSLWGLQLQNLPESTTTASF